MYQIITYERDGEQVLHRMNNL